MKFKIKAILNVTKPRFGQEGGMMATKMFGKCEAAWEVFCKKAHTVGERHNLWAMISWR